MNNIAAGCLCGLFSEVLYGLSYIFTKNATDMASPFFLLGWRFLVAFIAINLCVAVGILKIDLKNKPKWPLFQAALFSPCGYFIGETIGIANTTTSESSVFIATVPIASIIASALILKEKPTKNQLGGIFVTFVGVIFTVVAVGVSSSFSVVGYSVLAFGIVSYGIFSALVGKLSDYNSAEILYIMLLTAAVVFGALAFGDAVRTDSLETLLTLPFREKGFLVGILYQGIGCSVGAFLLTIIAIAKIGVDRTASFTGVSTVVSIFVGVLVLGEKFTAMQVIGVVLIILGVYMANAKMSS